MGHGLMRNLSPKKAFILSLCKIYLFRLHVPLILLYLYNAILTSYQGHKAMKDLISYIVRALVDHPEEVAVSEVEGGQTVILELRVAKNDFGKVIGRHGRTAQAIRTILSAASGKAKKRFVLEIVE